VTSDLDGGLTPELGHLYFIPVEGTLSAAALAKPENWMPYAIDLGPYVAGPISFGPDDEAAGD
jgi:hypothetical protein